MRTREKQGDPRSALLGGAMEDFSRARDALAKELAAKGESARAKEIKSLRKPTVSVWVVNRLAHEARDDLDALFEVADRMRTAKGDALREAMRDRTAAQNRLLAAAREILTKAKRPIGAETLRRVSRTLHAAEIAAGAREQVEEGVVDRDLDASSFEDDAPPPPRARSKATAQAHAKTKEEASAKDTATANAKAKAKAKAEARARKEEALRARRVQAEREAAAKRAEHALASARRATESADRRVEHAEQALRKAQEEARKARAEEGDAERAWRAAVAASASNDT